MTDIDIQSDVLDLSMNLLEVDDHDPNSLRWAVRFKLKHPTGDFSYSADDIWLDTSMWDEFVLRLEAGAQECAYFTDQTEYLRLSVERRSNNIGLAVHIREPLISKGNLTLDAEIKLELDGVFISRLLDGFRSFPVFW